MSELQEIPEKDFDEYGKGLDSTEQDEIDAEEMGQYDDLPVQEPSLGGIYSLFGKVMDKKDMNRISNLSKEELGTLSFNVRGSLYVAQLAEALSHQVFADFFKGQAYIINETSLSKEGYLVSTFVTSKRYAQSTNGQREKPLIEPEKKKSSFNIFSKKK